MGFTPLSHAAPIMKVRTHLSRKTECRINSRSNGRKSSSDVGTAPSVLPCFDELDKKLIQILIPMIVSFSITPLVGANDLFWTNRMGNPLAVAGLAASNQVYKTGFWLASFLPTVTSTLVSKENAKKNMRKLGGPQLLRVAIWLGHKSCNRLHHVLYYVLVRKLHNRFVAGTS